MENEKLFKLKEAAELLGVNSETIRRWDRSGKIKLERTVSGYRLVPLSEINRVNAFRRPHVVPLKEGEDEC